MQLAGRHPRQHDMRLAVDGDDAHLVMVAQQVQDLDRAEVGQIHLAASARHRHRHAARTVQRDHDGHRELAVLAPQLHRDGEHGLDSRAEVAADTEGVAPAGHQQAGPGMLHPRRDRLQNLRADPVGARVLDDQARVAGQRLQTSVDFFRCTDAQLAAAGGEESWQM